MFVRIDTPHGSKMIEDTMNIKQDDRQDNDKCFKPSASSKQEEDLVLQATGISDSDSEYYPEETTDRDARIVID
jgi:hypothetical protein